MKGCYNFLHGQYAIQEKKRRKRNKSQSELNHTSQLYMCYPGKKRTPRHIKGCGRSLISTIIVSHTRHPKMAEQLTRAKHVSTIFFICKKPKMPPWIKTKKNTLIYIMSVFIKKTVVFIIRVREIPRIIYGWLLNWPSKDSH